MLTDRDEVRNQYRDAANLRARSAIYRFAEAGAIRWPRWVFDQLELPAAEARILEVGCGDGGLWVTNLERLPRGWRVAMLDLSPGKMEKGPSLKMEKALSVVCGEEGNHSPGACRGIVGRIVRRRFNMPPCRAPHAPSKED